MHELGHFIINSNQVFLALLVCAFSFLLVQDLEEMPSLKLVHRRFLALFFLILSVGVFFLFFAQWQHLGPFLSIEFALLVIFSIIHPKYAISFLVFLFLSRPWETFDDQMMSSMPRDISYLTILSMIGQKLLRKQLYFRFNAGTFFILGFSVWMFLSGFLSAHSSEALVSYEEVFSKGIILFLLMQNCLDEARDLQPVKAAFVLAILEKCFVSYYKSNVMALPTIVEEGRERLESVGMLSNSNDIAAIFVLAIPFTVFFIVKSNIKPINWLMGAVAAASMSVLVWQSASRGALLGIFALAGAYALARIKNRKVLILFLALGLAGTLASFSLMTRNAEDLEGSTSNRTLYWKAGLNMAVRNPLFGVGYWGFPKNLVSYAPDGNVGTEKEHMTAHSSWVLVLAEGGFMALALFLALWIYAAYAAWKLRLHQPEYIMGIAGYGIAISFLSHSYTLFPYIVLALAITHYNLEKGLVPHRG